jgi:hypothetical protein
MGFRPNMYGTGIWFLGEYQWQGTVSYAPLTLIRRLSRRYAALNSGNAVSGVISIRTVLRNYDIDEARPAAMIPRAILRARGAIGL